MRDITDIIVGSLKFESSKCMLPVLALIETCDNISKNTSIEIS
jgi:hypothetical protein